MDGLSTCILKTSSFLDRADEYNTLAAIAHHPRARSSNTHAAGLAFACAGVPAGLTIAP